MKNHDKPSLFSDEFECENQIEEIGLASNAEDAVSRDFASYPDATQKEVRRRLSKQQEQALREYIGVFIESPIATTIMDDFERLRYNKHLGGEQQCMLLTGDTGSGKSR